MFLVHVVLIVCASKNRTGDSEVFSKLENGYLIQIVADEVQDAIYPGELGVYSCKRLKKGTKY